MDELRQFQEVEFRDGTRMVPNYLASILVGIETHRMAYEEAIQTANRRLEADNINAQQDKILAAHFRELR
jgi:hypothetical protein